MARRAERVGVGKAEMSPTRWRSPFSPEPSPHLGAIFATTVTAGASDVPFGVLRLLGGLAFSLGLILVVVAGAELFTGNNLIVMAWASGRVKTMRVAQLDLVYLGNFAGAIATVLILYVSKQYELGEGAVGVQALSIAAARADLGFVQAVALGAFCNGLVCLAVALLRVRRRTRSSRSSRRSPPSSPGFEHCVANMFFIPMGLFISADEAFVVHRRFRISRTSPGSDSSETSSP